MSNTFRAPVTTFTPCSPKTRAAIDALLSTSDAPACLRLDIFVADPDSMLLIKDGVSFYQLNQDGSAGASHLEGCSNEMRFAFLEVLGCFNEDPDITELVSTYPLPWSDGMFCESMKGRHLSMLFLKDGVGAVIQEYIPTWIHESAADAYLTPDATADERKEIMSVFTQDVPGNHQRLVNESKIADQYQMLSAMFEHHADHDVDATLAPIDPLDRI